MKRIVLSRLRKLPRRFYLQPTLKAAEQLIGKVLVHKRSDVTLAGIIVEVEAYLGSNDPASHAFKGMTKRNEVMFRQGGHLYVYFTYGMHYCCNVVTEAEGIGHAVLLRAVEPVAGLATMSRNRRITLDSENDTHLLCSGPAKLCEAFGIGWKENGTDLCGNKIWIAEYKHAGPVHVVRRSTRVGISNGREHRWRFYAKDNPFVSRGKPS
jgi:DNA-3-methyladenine glycosylase